jgi:transcriptional regulator with XRE-family HTH domain
MIEPDKFLAARKAAALSQLELARRSGVSQQLIAAIEKGGTRSTKFLPHIARALSVAPGDIDTDWRDPPVEGGVIPGKVLVGNRDFPIHSSAEGGQGQIIVSSDAVDFMPRPSPVAQVKDAYGVYITGESMVPEFEPGDIAIVNPHLPIVSDVTCIFYAEQDGTARATIKRLRRQTADSWLVKQWNPPSGAKHDFALPRKEWWTCHRTLGKYSRR